MGRLKAGVRALWRSLCHRADVNSEMEQEFRFHMEQRADDLVAAGLSRRDAVRRARLEFGGTERYREEGRSARGLGLLDEIRSDARYAARSLLRSPGFAIVAILMLGLGVGANTAAFSLISTTLFRPPPFADPDRLVVLHQTYDDPGSQARTVRWSFPEYEAAVSVLRSFSHVAAWYADDVNLSGTGLEAERVRVEMVTPSYLPALGVAPLVGGGFPATGGGSSSPVTVLGHDLWVRALGARPDVLGSRILLNGIPLTVVGVMPPGFRGLTGDAALWFPQSMAPAISYEGQLTSPEHFHGVIARLRPGVTSEDARAEVMTTGARAATAAHVSDGGDDDAHGADLIALADAVRSEDTVRAQLVLAGAALFVLLIAITNLSALLLARATVRARENAVRAALGASRWRLVRQQIAECAVLGLSAAIAGVLLALWAVRILGSLAPVGTGGTGATISYTAGPAVDWRVIGFAAALSIGVSIAAGVVSGRRALSGNNAAALKMGARGSTVGLGTLRRPTVLSAAAVAQVSSALVLLIGAGIMLDGFGRLRAIDPGFEPDGVIAFGITPPMHQYGGDAAAPLLERLLERIETVPGVRSASVSLCTPFASCSTTPLYISGRTQSADPPIVGRHYVGPDHFRTLGIQLLRGRALTHDDRPGRTRVAVINETAARTFWPGEDPIGRRVWFGSGGGFASPDSLTEIVGIVRDVLYAAPGGVVRPDFYTSYLQFTWPYTTVIVQSDVNPSSLVSALRAAVTDVDPNLPIDDVRTMRERGGATLAEERFATIALTTFAGLGLLLASLGIYGIMTYSVAQRRREIGIRLALGSSQRRILRFVVGQGLSLTAAGLVIGTAAAVALSRTLTVVMLNAGSTRPLVFVLVVVLMLTIAALACWLPARAATRVNPVETIAAD